MAAIAGVAGGVEEFLLAIQHGFDLSGKYARKHADGKVAETSGGAAGHGHGRGKRSVVA